MKILLVKPYNQSDHIQPSLGLGYLATALRKAGQDVHILDCIKDRITIDKFPELLRRYHPDVLGLQCYTFDLPYIGQALRIAKKVNKDIITIVGGPHPTALPEEMMRREGSDLDFLFAGEAEIGFPKLVQAIEKGDKDLSTIPGLVFRDRDTIKMNPRIVVEDIDSLGYPAWDLIHPQRYPECQHGAFFKQFPIAPIMVTRGCPYPCTFCAGNLVSGKKIRRRSIDSVLSEIIMLKKDFGIKEFHIIDDNFTMDAEYTKDFLRRLKALDLGMSWAVPNGVRMDSLDEEMLRLMKEAGLYLISLGIESGSDDVLRSMKKGITTGKMRSCIKMIDAAGIDMAGFFILGFPGETVRTMNETVKFAAQLPLKRANFFTYLPFPGTESYQKLSDSGELKDVDWESFYFTNAAFTPRGLTRKDLKSMHRRAFATFYLRPGIMLYQLKSIKSLRHFSFLAKRFMRWIVAN